MAHERRYDEDEVRRILGHAGELQAREADRDGGLTIGQLEEVAREAGLDPAHVRRAAESLPAPRSLAPAAPAGIARWRGGPTQLVAERRLSRAPTPAMHERLVSLLREWSGASGDVSVVGSTLSWRGRVGKARIEVELAPDGGGALLRVRADLTELAADTYGGRAIALGGGAGFLAVASTISLLGPAAFAVGGALVAAGALAARHRYARLVEEHEREARSLADALASRLDEP